MGAADTELNRAIGAKFLIGAVARVMKPGAKVDTAPVFESRQGLHKSQVLAVLGGEWFSDDMPADLKSKDAGIALQGVWIMEQSEMHGFRKADVDTLKSFMSRCVDRFRPPYGRVAKNFPRQCVLAGTMNPSGNGYLVDETGDRRFWPVLCGVGWPTDRKIDLDALREDKDQLWAEARVRFQAGEAWWLDTADLGAAQEKEADARYDGDVWTDIVLSYVENKASVTMGEILSALQLQPKECNRSTQTRIGAIMHKAKWIRKRDGGGDRKWRYYNPDPDAAKKAAEKQKKAAGAEGKVVPFPASSAITAGGAPSGSSLADLLGS
jgi:predicted P-loop ATPase